MPEAANPCPSALALQIIGAAEDGFVALDQQFRFLYANPAAERLLGMKEAELIGRCRWEACPITAGTPLETACRQAMNERIAVNLESFDEPRQKWFDVQARPSEEGGLIVRLRDITGRKRAEEQQRRLNAEAEQRAAGRIAEIRRTYGLLGGIMAGTSDKIAAQDTKARYTAFNQAYKDELRKTLGVEIETGMSMSEALAGFPEDHKKAVEIFGRALRGETSTVELEFGDPARQRNWYQLHFFPIRDIRGTIVGTGQIVRDVSQRRHAADAVQAERQRFSDVLDQLPAYLVLLSPDYHVPFANRFFRERFGESHGRRCYEYLFNRNEPCEVCDTYSVLKTRAPHRWEWTGPDGRNYDIYDFPFQDTDGSSLIMEVGLDITERKQAEAELEQHRHNLEELVQERTRQLEAANARLRAEIAERQRAQEELLRAKEEWERTFDSVPDLIAILDGQHRIVRANRAMAERLGVTPEQCLGAPCYAAVHGLDAPPAFCPHVLTLQDGREHVAEVHEDGLGGDFLVSTTPLRDEHGRMIGSVHVARDITARKKAEEQLRRLAQFPEENPNPVLRIAHDGTLLYANAPARACLAALGGAEDQPLPAAVRTLVADACRQDHAVEAEIGDGSDRVFWFTAVHPPGERYVNLYVLDITARKRAEEELSRNREWLRVTLTSIGDGVIAGDTEGRITFLNPVAASLTGWTPEEALGQPVGRVLNIVDENTREPAEDLARRALNQRRPVTMADHGLLLARNGREISIEDSAAPILDAAGEVAGVVLVFHDVTEKRRAQQALRESRADLNRAQAVAHTGSWRLDVRRDELCWSEETGRMFGITAGTPLTYQAFLRTVHPEDRDYVDRSWTAALRGEPYDIEHRVVVGDAVKWARERAELEFDPQGALLGGFGTVQDITERKRAEERIHHHNAVLEGINRILTEALTCDTEEQLGRICLAVAEQATGSKFGFVGEINAEGRLDAIAISDPGWRAPVGFAIHGIYGRVLLDGKSFYTNDPASHPDSVGIPDGHPELKAFLGVPLKQDGKTIGIIAVGNREGGYRPLDLEAVEALAAAVMQVFMRKRAERAVRAGEERLRQAQKMESIGLLAGGIAHDFNNLLATIMGYASLLRDEALEESWDKLEAVIQATEKAADLTRRLLAYAGKGRFVVEALNLSRIVRDMTDLLGTSIPKKGDLTLALMPGLPAIEADRGQLQQIVMNLVINAAEAIGLNQSGKVTVSTGAVDVSATDNIRDEITGSPLAPGNYVRLEVEDTGCGMDQQTRAKIFDPFFTTKFVGRGLGLAAVAGIVQAHRGAIQLETAPGRGSTFRVFLPAGAAPDSRQPHGRPAGLRGRETVLLVDDEQPVCDFVRDALERYGYTALVAKNGQEAVRIFEENADRIGLVLLDLLMPVMGGGEAIDLLKSKRPDLRVIVMSGYSESETLKLFAGKGVAGFLQKPFTAPRLAEALKAVLTDAAGSSAD